MVGQQKAGPLSVKIVFLSNAATMQITADVDSFKVIKKCMHGAFNRNTFALSKSLESQVVKK